MHLRELNEIRVIYGEGPRVHHIITHAYVQRFKLELTINLLRADTKNY